VIAGSTGWAEWNALQDANTASPRRTHFVDISSLDAGSLDQLVLLVNNTVTRRASCTQPTTANRSVVPPE
jgi:hypothetical protein